MTVMLTPTHRWTCPNCGGEDVTHELRPHTRMHTCPKMAMMSMPMVPAGTHAKVSTVERGDYIGGEHVTLDENGRPQMSSIVEREDGYDCFVYAPKAVATRDETMEIRHG